MIDIAKIETRAQDVAALTQDSLREVTGRSDLRCRGRIRPSFSGQAVHAEIVLRVGAWHHAALVKDILKLEAAVVASQVAHGFHAWLARRPDL